MLPRPNVLELDLDSIRSPGDGGFLDFKPSCEYCREDECRFSETGSKDGKVWLRPTARDDCCMDE